MQIGNQLKQLRKKMRLSQKKLAKILGISQSYLSGIECGKKAVNTDVISELLVCLNDSPQRLNDAFYSSGAGSPGLEYDSESGELFLIDRNDREIRSGHAFLLEIDGRREIRLAVQTSEGYLKLTNLRPKLKNNDILPDSSMRCLGRVTHIIYKV